MNYGMYISAAGAQTSLYRTDVLASNLANLNTSAFKPDVATVRQRDAVRVEDGLWNLPSNRLLERLGAGPMLADNRIDFKQGPIDTTGNELDLAIHGDGFFLVRTAQDRNTEEVRLTRDGRLALDSGGRLVRADTGHPILDDNLRPITINPELGPVQIDRDGLIRQDGYAIGRVALVDVPDRSQLTREGNGLFGAPPETLESRSRASGRIEQRAIERSGVNEIMALNDLTSAARSIQANIGMMTYSDRMMEQAITRFGRIN